MNLVHDLGRDVKSKETATDPPNFVFGLGFTADAKAVDLTFAITKRVRVQ